MKRSVLAKLRSEVGIVWERPTADWRGVTRIKDKRLNTDFTDLKNDKSE